MIVLLKKKEKRKSRACLDFPPKISVERVFFINHKNTANHPFIAFLFCLKYPIPLTPSTFFIIPNLSFLSLSLSPQHNSTQSLSLSLSHTK